MQSRLTETGVLTKAKTILAESKVCIQEIDYFIEQFDDTKVDSPTLELPHIVAKRLRVQMTECLQSFTYPSENYNAIHNVLILLGYYFPCGLGDDGTLTCPITAETINDVESRFVLDTGHHLSIAGIDDLIRSANDVIRGRNPYTNLPMSERDYDRMNLITSSPYSTHILDYMAGGLLVGMFFIVIPVLGIWSIAATSVMILTVTGIIHSPILLATLVSSHLWTPLFIMGIQAGIPLICGNIGAAIGCIPTLDQQYQNLKAKIGEVIEISGSKLLKFRSKQGEKKNSALEEKTISPRTVYSKDDLDLRSSRITTHSLKISPSCPNLFKAAGVKNDSSSKLVTLPNTLYPALN